jgi:hypothetical protein
MAKRIKIDGVWYDASNAPPWYEHWVPGGLHLGRTMQTARDNARRNARGNDIQNAILWLIVGLILFVLIWFVVAL